METEDLVDLHLDSSIDGSEKKDLQRNDCKTVEADPKSSICEVREYNLNGEILGIEGEVEKEDRQVIATEGDKNLGEDLPILHVRVEVAETVCVTEIANSFGSEVNAENGSLSVQDGSPSNKHKRDGSSINKDEIDGNSISGAKRARVSVAEQQPSVHVKFNSLTRDSKLKLEELLQKWSEWHTQHCSSSHDTSEVAESGEQTFFPALHVGLDKSSAVSFWMDDHMTNDQSKEFITLDSNAVPLYDRGYSLALTSIDGSSNLEGGLQVVDASRCFNCGSYNHALKECPKPRDNVAVNNARKQHKSKRNQNTSSRNPTRYYQDSPGGKYDGLKPGALGAETRQLLGLGELDPPPWLNRMREIGYPPGYLDPDEEDQPSGITIFADEEISEEKEDGEIPEKQLLEGRKKMSVGFPGINAPIPENADERLWGAGLSTSDMSRSQSNRRYNYHSSEPMEKGQYHEERWSRDYRDEGPPGCESRFSPTVSSYSRRYGGHESSYTSPSTRGNNLVPSSPSFGRSLSDRGNKSPLVHEGSSYHGSYSSLHSSFHNRMHSPHSHYEGERGQYDLGPDSSSHRKDKHETHRHHSWR